MSRLNRERLQKLSEQHLEDARILLEQRRWPGAYYLGGYCIECAIKACVAKQIRAEDFPEKNFVNKAYTHNLADLVKLAGLEPARIDKCKTSSGFELYWSVIEKWSEESRYDSSIQEQEARDLLKAISDNQEGVLPWIKLHW
jgi:hypothetical protein